MGLKGARPKPPGQAITRVKQRHEWLEVPDVPNLNPPPLPPRRHSPDGRLKASIAREWPQGIPEKWAKWAQMPHTVTWTVTDWDYAIDSLHIAAKAFETEDVRYIAEMRLRERMMGTTHEARLGTRIRYVEPVETNKDVTSLDDYRNLV